MSLINDALKRARQNQPPPEPAGGGGDSGAPMRPVDPRHRPGSSASPLIVGLIVLVLLMAGVMFYLAGRSSARSPSPNPAAAGLATITTQALASSSVVTASSPTLVATNIAIPAPKPPETVVVTAPPPVMVTQVVVITTNVPAPAPTALRLQGILYSPTRPSALINGKTVFIGERVGDARVLAITESTVTVVQGGQTNVISLPE